MKKIILVLGVVALCLLIFVVSCRDNSVDFTSDVEISTDTKISVNSSRSYLDKRLTKVNESITTVNFNKSSIQKTQRVKPEDEEYTWELAFEVNILEHNNQTLSATHIEIVDQFAYVSYNVQGDVHMGALEILDLTDPENPIVVSTAFFDDVDINSLVVDIDSSVAAKKIWLAGSSNKYGAVVIEVTANNGVIFGTSKTVSFVDVFEAGIAASANSICVVGESLYITAGQTNGGLIKLSKSDLSYETSKVFSSAKYVIANGKPSNANRIVVLSTGDNALLRIYKNDLVQDPKTVDLGVIKHQGVANPYNGKSALAMSKNNIYVYVAMASRGFKAYNVLGRIEKYYSVSNMLTIGNTNAIAIDDDYIYMANGADGLAVGMAPTNSSEHEITPIFVWDLIDKPASANFVAVDNEFVFVAKGLGGVKVLRKIAVD